ncbi:hypothetical protein ColTof4_01090 [Colletotrichum tofieldiae]|nr:hypothetical protein ColTof3_08312 [Colletotrichum tofieldiae]GKT68667.1 hypothetical protein ColTof4_01090 [Colletotrichum tofieldiae]GKT96706.1 hypothetical protein Ct61P_14556 [Colletotrichum tofieldiae]
MACMSIQHPHGHPIDSFAMVRVSAKILTPIARCRPHNAAASNNADTDVKVNGDSNAFLVQLQQ